MPIRKQIYPKDQGILLEQGESLQTRASAVLRKANGLATSSFLPFDHKSRPISEGLTQLEQSFLEHDAQVLAVRTGLPGGVYQGWHISGLDLLDSQRAAIRGLIDQVRLRLKDYREEIKFNCTMWASILALALSFVSIGYTNWLYKTQVKREDARDFVQFQRTLDGVIFELTAAKDLCTEFINSKDKRIKEMGSPAWLLRANAIDDLLRSGRVDNKKVYLALFYLADLFSSLNSRNQMMASASVDLLSPAQRKHFLKDNLTRFAEHCKTIVDTIEAAEPTLKKFAQDKGLVYESVDFESLNFIQSKDKGQGSTNQP